MNANCMLAPDINKCKFFEPETGKCIGGPDACGFYEKVDRAATETSYQRKPRWYEEFLK